MDKKLVEILYSSGLNAAEIAKDLGIKKSTVNKCIQRNFKELKYLHLKNRRYYVFEKKEIKKAVNYEGNRYMSDKNFICNNRSIYTTKKNGDIVLRKDLDCSIPYDAPKRFNNEFAKSC